MFHCSHCDAQYPKWTGKCTECGKWGTIAEEIAEGITLASAAITGGKVAKGKKSTSAAAPLLALDQAATSTGKATSTTIGEVDRVLGGGLVPGSVTLLAGEPGIGKSTLLAQLAAQYGAQAPQPVYYASGEESEGQVRLRLDRLGLPLKGVVFSNAVDVAAIVATAERQRPSLLIIDSIQTMVAAGAEALPGTPSAVRAATAVLVNFAKQHNVPVVLIGQVTKDGAVAGPKTLEHLVDTVLTLEGDPEGHYRLLRVAKHRFGSTEEVGVFEMTEKGLLSVDNPSARFVNERVAAPGSVITCIMEGNRPFLLEVQALVERSFFPSPVRRTSGFDSGRLQLLLAILSKRANIRTFDQDVFVNVVGGMEISEHAADLAVAAAIISAVTDKAPAANAVFFGELGLAGEVRRVPFADRRKKEAERLGYQQIVTPETVKSVQALRKIFS
jgi:DNA repair protein RadA/Sms